MAQQDGVVDGNEGLVRTVAALDLRLAADAAYPLVMARRGVTRFAASHILPALREYVCSATEQALEQRQLFGGRRRRRDARRREPPRVASHGAAVGRSGTTQFLDLGRDLVAFPIEHGEASRRQFDPPVEVPR